MDGKEARLIIGRPGGSCYNERELFCLKADLSGVGEKVI